MWTRAAVITLISACANPDQSEPRALEPGTTTPSLDTSPADDTGPTTQPAGPREPVEWYTTIVGRVAADGEVPIDEAIGDYYTMVGDLWGEGHDNLATYGVGEALIFRGLPGPGEVSSGIAYAVAHGPRHEARRAGDVNGDGYDDLWVYKRLFLGPLEPEVDYDTDWHAEMGPANAPALVGAQRVEGGFDADGDGHVDAIEFDDDHQAFIHYGPFEAGTTLPIWGTDDPGADQVTRVRTDCGTGTDDLNPWVWPDLFGLGRTGVALLNENSTSYYCPRAVEIFDVSGPRGQDLSTADRITSHSGVAVWPGGDYDGDGHQDLFGAVTFWGPFTGGLPEANEEQIPQQTFSPLADVMYPTGDMNGDGRPEILMFMRDPTQYESDWWILPSTHVGEGLDIREIGVPLKAPTDLMLLHARILSGDLDGDGKADLVFGLHVPQPGKIWIWRGADLFPDE